jgi:hypothetical protein
MLYTLLRFNSKILLYWKILKILIANQSIEIYNTGGEQGKCPEKVLNFFVKFPLLIMIRQIWEKWQT